MYAFINSSKTIEIAERELLFGIGKTYELYHHILWLPTAVANYAAQEISLGMQKINPSEQERNPNTKFAQNVFVRLLRDNSALQAFYQKNHFVWQQEVIKNIFHNLKNAEYYQKYMQNAQYRSFTEDKMIILKMLENEVEDHDFIYAALEEQSIYWVDDVEYALSHALKTCRSFAPDADNALLPMYKDSADEQFANSLLLAAASHANEYRTLIEKHTDNWEVSRIALMDIVFMVTAIAELLTFSTIPVSVTLNEYIEIVKYYSTSQSSVFINGILDKIVVDLGERNMIPKIKMI
jgi:N utilization substance protein B